MPAPFPTSFASAAAGTLSNEGNSNTRNLGGDWSRARPNGATQTFRRPSATSGLTSQRDDAQSTAHPTSSTSSPYVPPHMASNHQAGSGRSGATNDTRYSKEQLLDMYKTQEKMGYPGINVSEFFIDGWQPNMANGTENGGWGRRDDHRDAHGSDVCWDHQGNIQPLGLLDLTEEEREVFSTSVNSTIKPTSNTNKDGTPREGLNRRLSTTQTPNTNSPLSTRPGGRRRESSDMVQARDPLSPSSSRFSKDEGGISSPPPSLMRRKTDFRESLGSSIESKDQEHSRQSSDHPSPFGSLKRTNTNPVSAGLNGPSSPWSNAPQSAGFAPMGAFGNFAAVDPTSDKKPAIGGFRSESRFKGLMNASSSENINSLIREKTSHSNLEKLLESSNEQPSKWDSGRQRNQISEDSFGEEEDDRPAGSAALGGDDASPPPPQASRFRHSENQTSYDDIGFSSVGMSSEIPPFREMMQRREYSHQQTPQRSHTTTQSHEPMSPTNTNPYQSPENERAIPHEPDLDDPDFQNPQFQPGVGYGQPGRSFQNQFEPQDRSQSSSGGTSRPFSGLGGLGSLGAIGGGNPWSAAPGAIGTPSRAHPSQTPGFGGSAFSNFGDIGSPAQSAFGGGGFFGVGGPSSSHGPIGRGSKLGSLFPTSAHDQGGVDGHRHDPMLRDNGDIFARSGGGFAGTPRDPDGSFARGGHMENLSISEKRSSGHQGFPSLAEKDPIPTPTSASVQAPFTGPTSNTGFFARPPESDVPATSNQLPASQQRQMVMPDRMRWIYRDPSGATQGPWSGLEMHDWYKAGFFSPELQVKKLEDGDYEPLAQLIRRIGNSREPFLVPQIGIPHGTAPPPNPTAGPTSTAGQSSSAQPPFASSFPSFGTTLTAEQQNALERRKQEEQYLMARQKEHLAQQQIYLKQMQQMQGGISNQQLHHQSSGQSLHSQPSFGSITSPSAYQPGGGPAPIPNHAPVPGFFDGPTRNASGLGTENVGAAREEDFSAFPDRHNMNRGNQMQFQAPYGLDHQQQVNMMMQERARLAREQEQFDLIQRNTEDPRAAERLEQYKQLRAQGDDRQTQQVPGPVGGQAIRPPAVPQSDEDSHEDANQNHQSHRVPEALSLSEQVQKAAAKHPLSGQPQSPWAKIDPGMPQPLPPPQSSSPMPAPTPQRNRQSVAEALNAESQSPSQSESVETPSATIAPWAKESGETTKGPSLKEIQAMEAQKAAQREEIQAAARKAVAEQQRLQQQSQAPIAPAPGLPSTSNWASSVSPAVPATSGNSAWTKSNGGKPAVATPVPTAKKTLAQIQKEEEARKTRATAAAAIANPASSGTVLATAIGGKRYADLAGKPGQPVPNPNNTAWTTVGAGGKTKNPATAPPPTMAPRTASGGVTSISSAPKPRPAAAPSSKTGQQSAMEEFHKWSKSALSKGLDSKIAVDGFVSSLLDLPAEADIISDSIYANSQTLDGRRFAEEFLRRRKLADRGIIADGNGNVGSSPFSSSSQTSDGKSGGSGGWSEVAKKGGQPTSGTAGSGSAGAVKDDAASAQFKVVSGKKKAGKR